MISQATSLLLYYQLIHSLDHNQMQTALTLIHHQANIFRTVKQQQDIQFLQNQNTLFFIHYETVKKYLSPHMKYLLQSKAKDLVMMVCMIRKKQTFLNVETLLLKGKLQEAFKDQLTNLNINQKKIFFVELHVIAAKYLSVVQQILYQSKMQDADNQSNNYARSDLICYRVNIQDSLDFYAKTEEFLKNVLQKPMSIINNLLKIKPYSFFESITLKDLLQNQNCIISTPIANRTDYEKLNIGNLGFIIPLANFTKKLTYSNNHFISMIQRLNISQILSQSQTANKIKNDDCKDYCLTMVPTNKHTNKISLFFQNILPQIKPLSKWDALSYQRTDMFPTFRFKIATEGYWQHCPHSQFLQVFYLCNQSQIQWFSISADQYQKCQHKIQTWTHEEIHKIIYGNTSYHHVVQSQGEVVLIGSGHQHFWRVRNGEGTGILLNWSILLKNKQQLDKFLKISNSKQLILDQTQWKIDISHRQLILDYLSHQLMNITSKQQIKILANYVLKGVRNQQKMFMEICQQYVNQAAIKCVALSSKLRICGVCGYQIINLFCHFNKNALCFECLTAQLKSASIQPDQLQLCYIGNPSIIQTLLKSANQTQTKQNLQQLKLLNLNYQATYCQKIFNGSYQIISCLGQAINIQRQQYTSHIYFTQTPQTLQLYTLLQRSFYISLQGLMKALSQLKQDNTLKSTQIHQYLRRLVKYCKKKDSLLQWLSAHYQTNNFCLPLMNLLSTQTQH